MPRSKSLLVPCLTVFIASFCIMVLELVAGRLIARSLGSSLYTWTSVIGVVLSGITLGNYAGGHIADRHKPEKALAWLFAISSATCVAVIISNNLVGNWRWLWTFSWPVRVFVHVCLVFILPSTLLGTISPVVAKAALDRGLTTGKTVGDIYAWGAAGSIAGTFTAGYYLIAMLGSTTIVWILASVLLVMALLYWVRLWLLYIWAAALLGMVIIAAAPWQWARAAGSNLALRKPVDANIIYEDETAYSYITVEQIATTPDWRAFMQDKLRHSEIIMGDLLDLRYFYTRVFAAVTHHLSAGKDKLNVLVIGGGGYVYPRYVEKVWPQSRIDVVEIDPGVTKAATDAFGLPRDTSIKTITADARNYVDALLEAHPEGDPQIRYDFIYGDALNDYSVPFQLTTRQFNEKLARLLADDGVYMIELIDNLDSGRFLAAMVNTLEKTFPYVYVIVPEDLLTSSRNAFVAVAAKRQIDIAAICAKYKKNGQNLQQLDKSVLRNITEKTAQLVLTDDYAPVENLLSPVVRADAAEFLCSELYAETRQLLQQGKLDACIRNYRRIIKIAPTAPIGVYNEMGTLYLRQHKWADAIDTFDKALDRVARNNLKTNTASIHFNLAMALKGSGNTRRAADHLQRAIKEYRREIQANPKSAQVHALLAKALVATGNLDEAAQHFRTAVNLDPLNPRRHLELAENLDERGKTAEAIEYLRAAVTFMQQKGRKHAAATLQQYLKMLQPRHFPQNQ